MRLSKVTPLVVDAYRAERRKTCSPSTVFIETVVAKQLLRWCHSRRLIAVNPLASYRVPKVISKKRSSPSLEDVQAILSGSRPRLQRILGTLAFAGLRIGELRQLRVEDVDLADGWIRVESREGAETKTHRSRKIPIHPVLREILKEQSSTGHWFFKTERGGDTREGSQPIAQQDQQAVPESRRSDWPACGPQGQRVHHPLTTALFRDLHRQQPNPTACCRYLDGSSRRPLDGQGVLRAR